MRHKIFFISILVLASSIASAQVATTDTAKTDSSAVKVSEEIVFPRTLIGIRGGVNLADMVYSHAPVDRYSHFLQLNGMGGLFFHFQLGKSNFSLRPEVSYVGRGDSLQWLDVNYKFKAHYLDFRLPIMYNFRIPNSVVSPYVMVVPQFNMPFGGRISYTADDFPKRVTTNITTADINKYDASVMFGAGIDFLIRTKGIPLLMSVEAGYNIGLLNNFAQREIKDNPDVAVDNRSNILNKFLGAELWQERRKNRGIEIALRLAIPLDGKKAVEEKVVEEPLIDEAEENTPDTVYILVGDTTPRVPDTVYITKPSKPAVSGANMKYEVKDCYSFAEMYAFITLGVDISDKRICLFNINFNFDSYRLRPESKQPLNDVAMMMKAYPEMRIKVYGHTDSIGSDEYNDKLSLMRARSVINYLKSQGIDGSRMEPEGYGRRYPVQSNLDDQGRFQNRRVEIEVLNIGMRITGDDKEAEK